VNHTNDDGDSALHIVSSKWHSNKRAGITKILIDNGINIETKNKLGNTALLETQKLYRLGNVRQTRLLL
jgi:ankyrin repeat protein